MSTSTIHPDIEATEKQIFDLKQKLAELRQKHGNQPVAKSYTFKSRDGSDQSLVDLFGEKNDLILIHNMGKSCPYCTLWADGFNSLVPHLEDRAAFVVVSNDSPETQKTFAELRGWKFKMASSADTSFFQDMGFEPEPKKYWPGVSTFHKDTAGKITRVSQSFFGPGDDFCSLWHFFDLLKDGANNWQPKMRYQ